MEQQTQLTAEQVQKLFDFTKENHVNYIDVQYELVDHLATGIEEQLKSNPTLDFELAIKNEKQKFPLTGFYHFVEQKEKALIKYWNNKIWSILRVYLKLPQILLTLTLFISVYFFYLKNPMEVTMSIGFGLYTVNMIYQWYLIRKSKSKYLIIRHFYGALQYATHTAGFLFILLTQEYLFRTYSGIRIDQQGSAIIYALSVSAMLIVLMTVITGKFRKLLMDELHQKYSHLNLAS